MHRAGRCFIGELRDGMRDPVPDSLTLAIASSYKRMSASRSLWPGLVAVLYSRGPAHPDRAELARLVGTAPAGPPVLLLEACVRPEGHGDAISLP